VQHVSIANNGLEAVELAGKEFFDIILMDLNMPVMNGIEAAKQIKSSYFDPSMLTPNRIPFIAALSASEPTENLIMECKSA